jgi:hypothetical protein
MRWKKPCFTPRLRAVLRQLLILVSYLTLNLLLTLITLAKEMALKVKVDAGWLYFMYFCVRHILHLFGGGCGSGG